MFRGHLVPARARHAQGLAEAAGPQHHLGPGQGDGIPPRLHHRHRIPVYFCDPHKPWQRGSNENTNGLLRQYLPKGTDLSLRSASDLAQIAASLNNRPRKTLGFMKPSEKLAEILAHTG